MRSLYLKNVWMNFLELEFSNLSMFSSIIFSFSMIGAMYDTQLFTKSSQNFVLKKLTTSLVLTLLEPVNIHFIYLMLKHAV